MWGRKRYSGLMPSLSPSKPNPSAGRIGQCEGEHPPKSLNGFLAPLPIGEHHDLGVAAALRDQPVRYQGVPKFLEV